MARQFCTAEETDVIFPIIKWNGFFANHENIQVALLASSNLANRVLAIDTILSIRKRGDMVWERRKGEPAREPGALGIRPFKVPEINF